MRSIEVKKSMSEIIKTLNYKGIRIATINVTKVFIIVDLQSCDKNRHAILEDVTTLNSSKKSQVTKQGMTCYL